MSVGLPVFCDFCGREQTMGERSTPWIRLTQENFLEPSRELRRDICRPCFKARFGGDGLGDVLSVAVAQRQERLTRQHERRPRPPEE
jgi:hypothetical protein